MVDRTSAGDIPPSICGTAATLNVSRPNSSMWNPIALMSGSAAATLAASIGESRTASGMRSCWESAAHPPRAASVRRSKAILSRAAWGLTVTSPESVSMMMYPLSVAARNLNHFHGFAPSSSAAIGSSTSTGAGAGGVGLGD